MKRNPYAMLILAAVLVVAAISPRAAAAGWAGKSVATFKADRAAQKAPAKTPYRLMFVVPQDTVHPVCMNTTKTWQVTKGRAAGKSGAVWRENAAGVMEQVATFTLAKKKFVNGESSTCKDIGPLQKGDLVEILPKFSAMKKTTSANDKLVVSLWQPPPGP